MKLNWKDLIAECVNRMEQENLSAEDYTNLADVSISTIENFKSNSNMGDISVKDALNILKVVNLIDEPTEEELQDRFVKKNLDEWVNENGPLPNGHYHFDCWVKNDHREPDRFIEVGGYKGDMDDMFETNSIFDIGSPIRRMGEFLADVVSYVSPIRPDEAKVHIRMVYKGLKGRMLHGYTDPWINLICNHVSSCDECYIIETITIGEFAADYKSIIERLCSPLYDVFGLRNLKREFITSIFNKPIERRMG